MSVSTSKYNGSISSIHLHDAEAKALLSIMYSLRRFRDGFIDEATFKAVICQNETKQQVIALIASEA